MLSQILLWVTIVVSVLVSIATVAIVGPARLRRTFEELPTRLKAALPVALLLAPVLVLTRTARRETVELQWRYGWNASDVFFTIEGDFHLWLQTVGSWPLTAYFSFIYIYGYVFVLVFPIVAYLALPNTVRLRQLLAAYTFNYTIGLALYTLVIAFGPRQFLVEQVSATNLYDNYPSYQFLTAEVNHNTNNFPSLHTSLATTVAIFAYLTRDEYQAWFPLASVLAVSVIISTNYLTIHWAIDVVAGIVLAFVSVELARRFVGRWSIWGALESRRSVTKHTSDD